MPIGIQTQLFINNEFVNSSDQSKAFSVINPATEKEITKVQAASAADVDKAVAAARAAFEPWSKTNGSDRRDLLLKLADLMEKNRAELAQVESDDNGKPVHIADNVDIALCIKHYRYYAGWADKLTGTTIPVEGDFFACTVREPIGVVGAIIPWNFPLLMQAWKLGPALAAGCTVVMKLSEKTPLAGLMFAQLIKEAGFPPGVVNILNGDGPTTGTAIAQHMDIDKVAFTGSSAVGHRIAQASAASNLKKVTLELGGKSPLIIMKDADLDAAIGIAEVGLFLNHGQCCCASSRIFVEDSIYDEFAAKCVASAQKRKVGDPNDPSCDQGPQVDKIQFDKILGYIESGKQDGAKLLTGGKRVGDKGFFIESTVFGDVKDSMKIAKEEIFGPVMQLMRFHNVAEAIERANTTQFGLAAGVCSRDIGKAMHVAKQLKAGCVWINCYDNFDAAIPFGGYKESGWGREKGEAALDSYLETKLIQFPINDFK